jgi:phage-related protein
MDLFELVATLALDTSGYEQGITQAETKAHSFGAALSKGLGVAAKVGVAALGAAAAGVGALVKNSIESYAEYEQLVGGVETLFKGSADKVMQYAQDAYKTAGLSANEYMETVTGFSASLLQALGGDTAAAADMADQAIIDMSDNANKMGSDIGSIQRAYQGFAKQNYTMLDNLKLGYGGTKKEMERLLEDASKISGIKYDMENFSDVISAIHVIQTEMGITGTTAKEASGTISGSISAMKSAWQNLVTGVADENANFDTLINNFVDSAVTAGNNLLPRLETALQGVGRLVEGLAPVIAERLPALVETVLPPILSAASTLVTAVVKSLPSIVKTLLDALPGVMETILNTLADMSPELVELGAVLIVSLLDGITATVPTLLEKLPEIVGKMVETLINNAPKLLEAGLRLIGALATGIINAIPNIVSAMGSIVNSIADGIGNIISSAAQWGRDLIDNFTAGIKAFINKPIEAIKGLAGKIKNFLGFSEPDEGPLSNFHTYAPDMMALFAKGIKDNEHLITDQIGRSFNLAPQIAASAAGRGGETFTVPRANNAPRNINVVLTIDGREFAHAEVPYIEAEQQRLGVRLASR